MTYVPKTKPFAFQAEFFERTKDMAAYALLWEMGVGKTKPVIDTIGHLYDEGKINGALVLAPKAVAPNWVNDELPAHMSDEMKARTRVVLWDTSKTGTQKYQNMLTEALAHDGLLIVVMSYDGITTGNPNRVHKVPKVKKSYKGCHYAKKLLTSRRCIFVLDESARIKAPKTQRAKRVLAAGRYAPYRRIMTGTPVINSPFDVFTQLKFLDPMVWANMGCGTFAAFKAMFGVWVEHERNDNGQRFQTLVDYQNLPTLHKVVDSLGSRLLKSEVLDLPPKLYEKRIFQLSPAQRRLYDKLKKEFIVLVEGGDMISAPLAITRMLRLQQVTSGYVPTDGGDMVLIDDNPRLACLMDLVGDVPHQAIIWAKYQMDIDYISAALREADKTCVVYDGRVSQSAREIRRSAFKAGDVQYFVANPAAAGEGLTLHMAKTAIYYNNSHKLGDRLQSEDRPHRAGMDEFPVQYYDIIAENTIDVAILRNLRTKNALAAQVTGDKLKEWI